MQTSMLALVNLQTVQMQVRAQPTPLTANIDTAFMSLVASFPRTFQSPLIRETLQSVLQNFSLINSILCSLPFVREYILFKGLIILYFRTSLHREQTMKYFPKISFPWPICIIFFALQLENGLILKAQCILNFQNLSNKE